MRGESFRKNTLKNYKLCFLNNRMHMLFVISGRLQTCVRRRYQLESKLIISLITMNIKSDVNNALLK